MTVSCWFSLWVFKSMSSRQGIKHKKTAAMVAVVIIWAIAPKWFKKKMATDGFTKSWKKLKKPPGDYWRRQSQPYKRVWENPKMKNSKETNIERFQIWFHFTCVIWTSWNIMCSWLIIFDIRRTKFMRAVNKALKIAHLNYASVWISQ